MQKIQSFLQIKFNLVIRQKIIQKYQIFCCTIYRSGLLLFESYKLRDKLKVRLLFLQNILYFYQVQIRKF